MINAQVVFDILSGPELIINYGLVGLIIVILVSYNQRLMKKQDERERELIELIKNIRR